MDIKNSNLDGLFIIHPTILLDNRGFFTRTYCKNEFSSIGFNKEFVQFNHSFNTQKGTIRGMHFQMPPFSETKLIRCIKGCIQDVVIDLRKNSPTFLNQFSIKLSESNMISILVPEGFAHGFQTLEENSVVIYHHTQYYMSSADTGFRYDDPALKIKWELPPVMVSDKDKSYKLIDNNFKGINI
jgi:dTDP-4-dehydrorhamnose 3,5-epimerase